MRVAIVVGVILLAAAGLSALLYKTVRLPADPAAEAVIMAALDDMRSGRADALRARMTPEAAATVTPDEFQSLHDYVPRDKPLERRLVHTKTLWTTGRTIKLVRYELTYSDEGMLYEARLKQSDGGPWRLEHFNLNRATNDELAANRFTLAKPPVQILFMLLMVAAVVTMLTAFVSTLLAPRFKRKWLWAIVSLIGLCTLGLDWTTGRVWVEPLSLNLIGAGVVRPGYLGFFPWTLKFSLPIGAALAFWRLAKLRREAVVETLDTSSAGA